jgi:hypothetical protein
LSIEVSRKSTVGRESEAQTILQSHNSIYSEAYSSGISCLRSSIAVDFSFISHGVTFLSDEVHHAIKARQARIGSEEKKVPSVHPAWLKSLALSSNLARSQFITAAGSRTNARKRDLCTRINIHLPSTTAIGTSRTLPKPIWATGTTDFPFVDAYVRCLEQHG